MSYWNFNWKTPATEGLINNGSSFEEIIGQNDILSDVKTQNRTVIEYFTRPETVANLIKFLTTPPATDANPEQDPYRNAKISCEILCFDNEQLQEAITSNPEALKSIFGFFSNPQPEANLLKLVSRLVCFLISRRSSQMLEFLNSQENVIQNFLSLLHFSEISDIFIKMVNNIEASHEICNDYIQWILKTNRLVVLLIERLDSSFPLQVAENAANTLLEMLELCFPFTNEPIPEDPTLQMFTRRFPEVLRFELSEIFRNSEYTQDLAGLLAKNMEKGEYLKFIVSVSRMLVKLICLEISNSSSLDEKTTVEQLPGMLRDLLSQLDNLKALLVPVAVEDPFSLPFGSINKPFGFLRLSILELIAALVDSRILCVYQRLAEAHVFTLLVDIFFEYKWNNVVHVLVDEILKTVLDNMDDSLVVPLFEQSKIHERIAQAGIDCFASQSDDRYDRVGFMGCVTQIATYLIDHSRKNSAIQDQLNSSAKWNEYLRSDYETITKIQEPSDNFDETDSEDDPARDIPSQTSRIKFEDVDFPEDFTSSEFDEEDLEIFHNPDFSLESLFNTDENLGNECSDSDGEDDDDDGDDDDDDDDLAQDSELITA